MDSPEQLNFFEKRKISARPEPPSEKVVLRPDSTGASDAGKNKRIFDKKLERVLDQFYREHGAEPKNPQDELFGEDLMSVSWVLEFPRLQAKASA